MTAAQPMQQTSGDISKSAVASERSSPCSSQLKTPTPTKRKAPSGANTPEEKPAKDLKKTGFGGTTEKTLVCKMCSRQREHEQKGSVCQFCVLACRQLFSHQRLTEIADCERSRGALLEKSKELCETASREETVARDPKQQAKLIREIRSLVSLLPRFEEALSRLERLREDQGPA